MFLASSCSDSGESLPIINLLRVYLGELAGKTPTGWGRGMNFGGEGVGLPRPASKKGEGWTVREDLIATIFKNRMTVQRVYNTISHKLANFFK